MASGYGIEPTRFPYGVSTAPQYEPLGNYPLPDPFHTSGNPTALMGVAEYYTDFMRASDIVDYTVTGAGAAAALSTTVAGGAVVLTPASGVASSIYKTSQFIQFVAGQKAWFNARVAVSTLAGTARYGLQAGAVSTQDSLMFVMTVTTGVLSLVHIVGGVTTVLNANVGSIVAATMIDLAYFYDGQDLLIYVNDALVARIASPTLTSAILTPAFQSAPAAAETTTVDFVLAACEVVR